MPDCETETVVVKYWLDAEINGVTGLQRSGPFNTRATAEAALNVLLSRSNVNKATIVKEAVT